MATCRRATVLLLQPVAVTRRQQRFNLQFEERGGAELFDPAEDWQEHVDFDLNPDFFAEVVIGLADSEDGEINDVFARILLCREKDHKLCHIIWRE